MITTYILQLVMSEVLSLETPMKQMLKIMNYSEPDSRAGSLGLLKMVNLLVVV